MRAVTHLHIHARTERQNGPASGVLQSARGSGSGANGGNQARGRPGPAGRARGVSGSVYCVRSAGQGAGAGQERNLVVILGMHYWDQVMICREEGHGRGRALTFECVYLLRMVGLSAQRCTWPVKTAWRARWRSCCRSAPMPRLQMR